MREKLSIIFSIFIVGCISIEVGLFLRKLDENINLKIANPEIYNTSQLFKDVAAYSFNIRRLFRLFQLKRDHVMQPAKMLYEMGHPNFIKNISCEKLKSDFLMTEREYKDLLDFMDKITTSLNAFYNACGENPQFIGVPFQKPDFSMERISSSLEHTFKTLDYRIKKGKLLKSVEDYYYLLGKFTKKFILGRRTIMERAKLLFESGGPPFLKYYDYLVIQRAFKLTVTEAASLDNLIGKIHQRYKQFLNACLKNPNFESKVDFSSIRIIRICEKTMREILLNPSAKLTDSLFKQIREFYHVLGFLRRHNIPHRMELLHAMYETFGTNCPVILKPLDFDKLKLDFQLEEIVLARLKDYIGHLRRRFNQVQQIYLNSTANYQSRTNHSEN
ncbi:hypothetical protein J6590_031682 [Homalodisca vitripennis]|nr:hypothetical protein J6590_031682 [Homalodisca vitripennis]